MNENRIAISRSALRAINESLGMLFLPPIADAAPLRHALAKHYRVGEENVVVGNGSTEIMNALVLAQASKRKSDVLASSPTFVLYSILAKMYGLGLSQVPLRDYAHDIKSLRTVANNETRVIFLDSPHSITGKTMSTASVVDLADALPETVVVLDNVYGEFQADADEMSAFMHEIATDQQNILVCRSFSKVHALLGLRAGYGIGHPALIGEIQSKIVPYSVNSVVQAAAMESLRDTENVSRNVGLNERAKLMAYELLDSLGITYIPTQSSALLINFGSRAGLIAEFCKKRGIKCRGQEKCGIPGHIQVHLIDPETITPFLDMLSGNFASERRADD